MVIMVCDNESSVLGINCGAWSQVTLFMIEEDSDNILLIESGSVVIGNDILEYIL